MIENLIKNKLVQPSIDEIIKYMNEYTRENWIEISSFLESKYNTVPVVMYSRCSAMPGWNVKYKRGSKSFCTMYPDMEYFTILLILRQVEIDIINSEKNKYSKYFLNIMENSGSMNGCKWLMIGIDDSVVLDDIKRAIDLKNRK